MKIYCAGKAINFHQHFNFYKSVAAINTECHTELGPHMQVLGRFRCSSNLSQAEDFFISFYEVNSIFSNVPA
jgi:hypothetical protein